MNAGSLLTGLVVSTALFLSGCGGSADPQEIFGTASAGEPMSGKVYAKDSAGTAAGPVTIGRGGRFSIPAAGLKPPFVLKAEGSANGKPITLYSTGAAAGTINVNPMTDLILHVAAGTGNVESLWSSPASQADMVSPTRLASATDSVRKLLLPFLTAHGAATANPFSDPIQLGVGMDAVFDRIAITRDSATGMMTVTSLVNGATLATTTPSQIDNSALALGGHPSLRATSPVIVNWYGPSGMDFGVGYDDVSQNVAGTCVSFDGYERTKVGNVDAQYWFQLLEDSSSLTEQLGISAAAKIRMGLYRVTAQASYASESVQYSNSVFVAVYSEKLGYSYKLKNPKLHDGTDGTPNRKDQFKNDVTAFRASCGDRFLQTVTTGGKMLGIMKIETSSEKEKTSIKASLRAKSAVFNSYSGSFSSTVQSTMDQYQANITIFQVGPTDDATPTDFASFMTALQGYPAKVNACLEDVQKCAYKVTFADYVTIADGGTNTFALTQAMGDLIDNDSEYERILGTIVDIQARPELYEKTSIDLADLSSRITASKNLVLQAVKVCDNNSSKCAVPAGILDPASVVLPARKLLVAKTCQDYKTNYPKVTLDGEYRMYFETDTALSKPFYLYCLGMDTSTPKEYLTLKLTSPLSTSPSYNYSSSVGRGDAFTVFNKVGVLVNPSELAIVRNDFLYSTTTWVSRGYDDGHDDQTPYGQAKTSYIHSDWSENLQGRANLDFTGTPFAISETTEWVVTGSNSEFTNWHTSGDCGTRPNCKAPIVISPDRKSVKLFSAGTPGYNQPKADIRLKWSQ